MNNFYNSYNAYNQQHHLHADDPVLPATVPLPPTSHLRRQAAAVSRPSFGNGNLSNQHSQSITALCNVFDNYYGNSFTCQCHGNLGTPKVRSDQWFEEPKPRELPPPPSCYSGYERGNRLTDDEDSTFPAGLLDREFHMLHRNIPALRRSGVDITTIRQHFYPDGGWGWIICGLSFLAHVLTSGLQLSYGLLLFYATQHFGNKSEIDWLGALSWSVSTIAIPVVIAFCRKKSTRLLAVIGGLVLPLGVLFTSFATQLGQMSFSYGVLIGLGVSMVRESSIIMIGNYFKKRRQFVEMVAMSGEGVGLALFSVILKEGVGKMGWRLGLQVIAAMVSVSFFMGLLYRPASLYHPQRRAIQHLKNQRKKVKEKKTIVQSPKKSFIDLVPARSTTVRVLIITSAVSALGIYAPIFSMSLHAAKEGCDIQDLVLLQTFLGLSTTLGVVIAGSVIKRSCRINNTLISVQIVSQASLLAVAVSILFLSFVLGFRPLCVLCWIYGIGFGGFRYSLKMLALQRVKAKYFTKAWGLIRGAESLPVIISVPLTMFLNDYSLKYGRAGYFICSAAAAIGVVLIFFVGYSSTRQGISMKSCNNGTLRSQYSTANSNFTPDLLNRSYLNLPAAAAGGGGGGVGGSCKYMGQCGCQACMSLLQRSCYNCHQVPNIQPRCHAAGTSHFNPYTNSYCFNEGMMCPQKYNALRENQARCRKYTFGSGSIGANMGRKLQKSFSFVSNPCTATCVCTYPEQYCLPCTPKRPKQALHPGSFSRNYGGAGSLCHSSKSRSVPEGLSTFSQYCRCPAMHCQTYNYQRQRSQSLSKPVHFVEQITTSV
ncbi:monocarboxylate transporter 10 [Eupeodes corollae]|uniref:monocarboxylate transporter 10 n=1 Tax=Eupeodes corollae TaxID=290404 RepID=UPI0024910750|nr:monocarboxylate transporter 10 [Eupeodes corollae]